MENKLAPVVIFTYRRVIDKTIDSLLKNELAKDTDIYIYSDGSKNEKDYDDVQSVRSHLKTIKGFKSITIQESKVNKGLANSIISGVSKVIDKYGQIIVLEDDLIVSNDFLEYMNGALEFYQEDNRIWSISGYTPKLPCLNGYNEDLYLSVRSSSWGWATWIDRWNKVDWEVKDFKTFKADKGARKKFNLGGNDMYKMLELQMLGKIDSWAIRWCYSQFKYNSYSVFPKKSKIVNDGFDDEKGTHNNIVNNKWIVELDTKRANYIELDLKQEIIECFQNYYNLSIVTTIGYYLKKYGGYNIVKKLYKKIINYKLKVKGE